MVTHHPCRSKVRHSWLQTSRQRRIGRAGRSPVRSSTQCASADRWPRHGRSAVVRVGRSVEIPRIPCFRDISSRAAAATGSVRPAAASSDPEGRRTARRDHRTRHDRRADRAALHCTQPGGRHDRDDPRHRSPRRRRVDLRLAGPVGTGAAAPARVRLRVGRVGGRRLLGRASRSCSSRWFPPTPKWRASRPSRSVLPSSRRRSRDRSCCS